MSIDDLSRLVGVPLGKSQTRLIAQERIDAFADATDDHQWIHVDRDRAAKGPFGGTIAHGYLTLALLPAMLAECLVVDDAELAINYGLNRLRFPAPVPAGSAVRLAPRIVRVTEIAGGTQALIDFIVTVIGEVKPCVAGQAVYNYYRGVEPLQR